MAQAQKIANYTEEAIKSMTATYTAAQTMEQRDAALLQIQKDIGKSIPSIRAKLGQLGIYVKKVAAKSTGSAESKDTLVERVADNSDKYEGFFTSLVNANKTVIEYVLALQAENDQLSETVAMPEVQAIMADMAEEEAEQAEAEQAEAEQAEAENEATE